MSEPLGVTKDRRAVKFLLSRIVNFSYFKDSRYYITPALKCNHGTESLSVRLEEISGKH